jgi:hypothetical protein
MRALTMTRLLAALCVLLLMTFGSIARAGAPGRPIDRSGSPPDPGTSEIGDPDEPGGHIVITFGLFGRVFLFHVPSVALGRSRPVPATPIRPAWSPLSPRKGAHAR